MLALRVAVSLAAVLGLLWYLQRRLTKRTGQPGAGITVVSRQALGGKAQLVVVEVEGTRYVLGVTEQGVSVIDRDRAPHQISAPATAPAEPLPEAPRPDHAPLRRDRRASHEELDLLRGSILSPATWRQTAQALRRAR
ncbi:flagellar biosynthetic protein FliO [Microbacterium sediminis]|nr:flagellar biosynthetic protein FliO [Microbacterium sediminis]